jgi:hypothetical protein
MVLVKKIKMKSGPVRVRQSRSLARGKLLFMRFGYDRLKVDPGASFLVFSELGDQGPHIIINNN